VHRDEDAEKIQNLKSPHHGGRSEEDLRGQVQKLTAGTLRVHAEVAQSNAEEVKGFSTREILVKLNLFTRGQCNKSTRKLLQSFL